MEAAVTSRRARWPGRGALESDTIAPEPAAMVRGSASEKEKKKKKNAASAIMSCEIAEPRLTSTAAACGKSSGVFYFPIRSNPSQEGSAVEARAASRLLCDSAVR